MLRGALLFGCVVACSASPEPRVVVPAAPAATSHAAAEELAIGSGVDVAGSRGAFAVKLGAPTGGETMIAILVSTRLDPDVPAFRYTAARGVDGAPPRTTPSRCAVRARPGASAGAAKDAARPGAPPPPAKGTKATLSFRERARSHDVPVRLVATGASTTVWADETPAAPAVLDETFVTEFLNDFEATILPRARTVFGAESDIDGDGRIALFFTPRTARGTVAFFSGCDLEPRCPASNGREILYLTPPNAIAPPYNTPRAMKEILAHELEHLVHHNRKVLANRMSDDPDSAYLLEGFGALAQDALGFQAGNFYVAQAGLEAIDLVSVADVLREGAAYDRERDGPLRGGAYLFVRWLYDRGGGDAARPDGTIEDRGGPSLVRALLDAPRAAAAEIPARLGASAADLTVDFYTTLALGHAPRGAVSEACWTYLPTSVDPITGRQRGADLRARFHGQELRGPAVREIEEADGRLLAGGVELLVVEPLPGERDVSFRIAVDPAAEARLRVVRVR